MVRIFLENQELDINEGFTHQMTYAVDDLKNLDSKSTAYSKTIVLPGTTKNNSLLGNIFEIHNANFTVIGGTNIGYNFNATVSAKVRIEVNGIQIVKGVLRLMEIIIDGSHIEYEVVIFGELGGLYSKLGGRKLEDIDFSEWDHDYKYTDISNSWDYYKQYTGSMTFVVNRLYIYGINNYNFLVGQEFEIFDAGGNDGIYNVLTYEYNNSLNEATITIAGTFPDGANFTYAIIEFYPQGYGYYYPLIDYGMVSLDKIDYDVTALRPAIYVKEIMDKMITNAGYTWESNFFNSDFFTKLIIPNNQKNFEILKTRIFTGLYQGCNITGASLYTYVNNNALIVNTTTADNITYTYNGSPGLFNISYDVSFKTLRTSEYAFNQLLGYKIGFFKDRGGAITTEYLSANYDYYQYNSTYNPVLDEYSDFQDIGFGFSMNGIDLATGDKFYFLIFTDKYIGNAVIELNSYLDETTITIDSAIPIMLPIAIDDTIRLNNCIPQNILQKDFFTSIMKMFNLMLIEDKLVEKKLIIEPYVNFYETAPSTYIDWTYKIDRSNPIRIKPMSEANARVYKMNYKDDNDFYNENYKKKFNEGYSSLTYDNLLEFSKETATLEILFASTPIVGYGAAENEEKHIDNKFISTILKKTNTAEDTTPSVVRILYRKNITVEPYDLYTNIWDSGTAAVFQSGLTNFPYAGHLNDPYTPSIDISFGSPKEIYFTPRTYTSDNLFNLYYSPYIAEIIDKDSRLVTMKAKLTEVDIYNLDFRRLIFVDGVLYRLQKVIDYSAGELCTIELLRVINVIY